MTNFSIKTSFRHKSLEEKIKGQIICFQNCRLFRNGKFTQQLYAELWIRDGRVLDPFEIFNVEKQRPNIYVNCENQILAPGFLDIQINGAFGVDFTTIAGFELKGAQERIKYVAENLLRHGITGFCPTLITTKPERYKDFLRILNNFDFSDAKAAYIHGAHFEGPFINEHQSGCHPKEELIQDLTNECVDVVYGDDVSNLSIVTLAPELQGAKEAIIHLSKQNVKVSIGHSKANVEQAKDAIDYGATCVTHMFNSLEPFHHRNPGILGLLTKNETISKKQFYFGIIADGIHLAESTLQLVISLSREGCILVTDSISALGLGDVVHQLGDRKIKVQNNKATVEGTNILAGSVTPMFKCMKYFASCISKLEDKDGLTEALKAATLNPAKFLGINNRKGVLTAGSDADFVIMDEQFNILATFIDGTKCFGAEA